MPEKMELTGNTKLSDLLAAYPWLKEKLPDISEKFKMLNTPLGKVMLKTATISDMSKRSGMPEQLIINHLDPLRSK